MKRRETVVLLPIGCGRLKLIEMKLGTGLLIDPVSVCQSETVFARQVAVLTLYVVRARLVPADLNAVAGCVSLQ